MNQMVRVEVPRELVEAARQTLGVGLEGQELTDELVCKESLALAADYLNHVKRTATRLAAGRIIEQMEQNVPQFLSGILSAMLNQKIAVGVKMLDDGERCLISAVDEAGTEIFSDIFGSEDNGPSGGIKA